MNGHVLYTNEDFKDMPAEELDNDPTANAVINGGLSVCKICGEFEAGLYKPCRTRE